MEKVMYLYEDQVLPSLESARVLLPHLWKYGNHVQFSTSDVVEVLGLQPVTNLGAHILLRHSLLIGR